MSATTLSQAEKIDKLTATITEQSDHIAKSDKVLSQFMKMLEQPASKAGMSPEALIAKVTNNGQIQVMMDPAGNVTPYVKRRDERKGIGMGPMLQALAKRFAPERVLPGMTLEEAHNRLKEYDGEWEKSDYKYARKAALAESSGTTGGYTVPPGWSSTLMTLSIEESIVRPRATTMPMTTRNLMVPSLDLTTTGAAGQTPYTGGVVMSWESEAAPRPETEPKFKQTNLTAWEGTFYSVASNTLLQDNGVQLDQVLTNLFSMAIGWYTDYAFLRGTGTGQPLGIQNANATVSITRTTENEVLFSDIGNVMSRFFVRADKGSTAWVMHQSVIPQIYTMLAGSVHPLFVPFSSGVQEPVAGWPGKDVFGLLSGIPVLISEKVPVLGTTGDIGLYDFSKYLIGDRMDMQIEISPHYLFITNQIVWRVIIRVDGQPWLQAPITQADGNASYTVSPFVILHSNP